MTIRIPNHNGKLFELAMYEEVRESAPYGDIIYLLTQKTDGRIMLVANCPDGTIFYDHFRTFDVDNPGLQLGDRMTGIGGADFTDKRHTILFYITKTEQ